jgi:hypothetical protein
MDTGFMRLPRIGRSLCDGEPQTQTDRANELTNVARQDLTANDASGLHAQAKLFGTRFLSLFA